MQKVKCPNCGMIHEIPKAKGKVGLFESSYKRPYRSDAATIPLPGQSYKETPTNLPSMDTHVRIPLRQAIIFGLFDAPIGLAIGLGAGLSIAGMMDAASGDEFTPAAYILIAGSFGVIGGVIALGRTAKKHWPERLEIYDNLLKQIEEFTGVDLDGDGEIGEPMAAETLKVELQDQSGRTRLLVEFDTDRERFSELARLVVTVGEGFCEETAKKAGYTRKEWEGIRDKLIDLRAAAWKDDRHHKQGCYLREDGYRILGGALTPPLSAGNVPKTPPGTNERTENERF